MVESVMLLMTDKEDVKTRNEMISTWWPEVWQVTNTKQSRDVLMCLNCSLLGVIRFLIDILRVFCCSRCTHCVLDVRLCPAEVHGTMKRARR